uniref:Uncharacterized protein n=1 Tax=candidate division WOR-3 bacterium TaxID=2052148 RepID=A0A7C4UFU6_UNCW3
MINRRDFLKISGAYILTGLFSKVLGGELEHSFKDNFWKGNSFKQRTVDLSEINRDIIKARIDGRWREYKIIELPDEFMKWNIERRLETLENIKKGIPPDFAGPHSGMVASYGERRKDSLFTLNNAVKGIGFVPKKEFIKDMIKYMEETYESKMDVKLEFLKKIYNEPEKLNKKIQSSLELYTTEDFETHTFLNLMKNPVATIVFLDIPSYEIRTIARVIHPDDKSVDDYERDCVRYTNLIHSYFHGKFEKDFIGLLFYVIEVFDNSPGRKNALGKKLR